jgi:hypothetical protein
MSHRTRRIAVLLAGIITSVTLAASTRPLGAQEAAYARWRNAHHAVDTLAAGTLDHWEGEPLEVWRARLELARSSFLQAPPSDDPSAEERRAQRLMRADVEAGSGSSALLSDGASASARCADRSRAVDELTLISALYDCFSTLGNHLEFEQGVLARTTALEWLHEIPDARRREALFRAFTPLWGALHGDGRDVDSPYRRLLRITAVNRPASGDRVDEAARTVGADRLTVERWLVGALHTWATATAGPDIEPWDYWYHHTSATQPLDQGLQAEDVAILSARYFQDLGADLVGMGVIHDLGRRPGKAPLAYTDYVQIGQSIRGHWRPATVRVSATVEKGGLYVANEVIHEDGHAVHMMALRTRPAFFDLGDAVFYEAFADVPSWSVASPAFQCRYLGHALTPGASYEALYAGVMLDIAWGLFELRMLDHPDSDPNQVWTDITHRYLHVRPHPELAWWALRVQLVHEPGYMINYGLGAILTADMRARIARAIGSFDAGNARWYPWTAAHLLQFGESIETPKLLRRFLGRAVSDHALRQELRRIGATRQASSVSVASKIATASSICAAETTNGGMNRTVD